MFRDDLLYFLILPVTFPQIKKGSENHGIINNIRSPTNGDIHFQIDSNVYDIADIYT